MSTAHALNRLKKMFKIEAVAPVAKNGELHTPPALPAALKAPKKKRKKKASKLAKRAILAGVATKSSGYFYNALQKRAKALQQEGETEAAAIARAMTEDDKGKMLYKAMRVAANGVEKVASIDDSPAAEADQVAGFKSLAEVELDKQAKARMKADPSLSYAAAYTQIFELPGNKALRDQIRNDGLIRQMQGGGGIV